MSKLDAYIGRQVIMATLLMMVVIVSLDAIFALIYEIGRLRGGYQFSEALTYIGMRSPRRLYEYATMACFVGCLAGLGSLAASSELTVMRASGISTARISLAVLKPVILMMMLSVLAAEFAIPKLERAAETLKYTAQGRGLMQSNSGKGYWHREGNEFTRFAAADNKGTLYGLSIYQFDQNKELQSVRYAKKGIYEQGVWQLEQTETLRIFPDKTERTVLASDQWRSELTPRGLNVIMYEPRDMAISDLYEYASYLKKEGLNADKYLLSFWSKVNQPLGAFALVILGISFVFGPLRSVSPSFRIFSGIMVGLTFKYTEELLAPTSILLGLPPLLATLVPTATCFAAGFYLLRKAG